MPYALYLENDSFYIQRWTDMEDIKAARRRLSAAMDRADLAKSLLDDARATYALARRNFEELRDEEDRAARDLERLTSLRSALGVGDPEEDPEGKRREDNRKRKAAPVPSPTSRARPFVVVVGGRETPFSPLSFAAMMTAMTRVAKKDRRAPPRQRHTSHSRHRRGSRLNPVFPRLLSSNCLRRPVNGWALSHSSSRRQRQRFCHTRRSSRLAVILCIRHTSPTCHLTPHHTCTVGIPPTTIVVTDLGGRATHLFVMIQYGPNGHDMDKST